MIRTTAGMRRAPLLTPHRDCDYRTDTMSLNRELWFETHGILAAARRSVNLNLPATARQPLASASVGTYTLHLQIPVKL